MAVEWRKNKAGKPYLAAPSQRSGFHSCLPEAKAWYRLQHDALQRATEECRRAGLEPTETNLAAIVNPQKASA